VTGTLNIRNYEFAICEIAKAPFHIKPWSQPLVTGREGVSPDKLHFGVSEIAMWKCRETWAKECRNAETRFKGKIYKSHPTVHR
jgi:hypothetical protein